MAEYRTGIPPAEPRQIYKSLIDVAPVGFAVVDAEGRVRFWSVGAPIDIGVTDVIMPRMGGKELVAELAADRPSVKPLFTSGYTSDIVLRQGVMTHALAFLQKPFTVGALGRRVREALDS